VEEVIILDTSFIVAFYHDKDAHHERALELMAGIGEGLMGNPLVPEYVLSETLTVVAGRAGLATSVKVGRHLLRSEDVEIVPCTAFMREALEIFAAQRSGRLSFTDATIVAISRSEEVPDVATFDRRLGRMRGIRALP
jgi:predicted nucleic acid-binding protein